MKKCFGQWALDTARAEDDQAWLDYQDGIGLIAFCAAIVLLMKPHLAHKGAPGEVVNHMHDAW